MKALLAFALSIAFTTQANAFDSGRFGAESPKAFTERLTNASLVTTSPTTAQVDKCISRYAVEFCREEAKYFTADQFEQILEGLAVANVKF